MRSTKSWPHEELSQAAARETKRPASKHGATKTAEVSETKGPPSELKKMSSALEPGAESPSSEHGNDETTVMPAINATKKRSHNHTAEAVDTASNIDTPIPKRKRQTESDMPSNSYLTQAEALKKARRKHKLENPIP